MHRSKLSLVALASVVAIIAAACGKTSTTPQGSPSSSAPSSQLLYGGTLHVGLISPLSYDLDPSRSYDVYDWWLLHDMGRTLMSYRDLAGQPGEVPEPDIAAAAPQVSNNYQTWTFQIRQGVKFGPPLDRQVTCQDFMTAFKREADPAITAGYPFYFSGVIKGFSQFSTGMGNAEKKGAAAATQYFDANQISGIDCSSPSAITFNLEAPTPDFAYRVTLPATAPLPAEAVAGHNTNYGSFYVSTGPYMIDGIQNVNFKLPAKQQTAPVGYQIGKSLVLVKNPDWSAATDPLRKAYVNKIEISIGGATTDLFTRVQANLVDFVADAGTPPTTLQTFQSQLPKQVSPTYVEPSLGYIWLNLTVPPFNDVHVRQAVNWIIDKAAQQRIAGGPKLGGEIATHILPPTFPGSLGTSYNPYPSAGNAGNLAQAQAAMKLSKTYDPKGDGKCDVAACNNVLFVVPQNTTASASAQAIQADLAKIGINLKISILTFSAAIGLMTTPKRAVPMGIIGWAQDYADPITFFNPLFNSTSILPNGNSNYPLVGLTPAIAKQIGVTIPPGTVIPSVDSQLKQCISLAGQARVTCWNSLDKYLTADVAAWVPINWQDQTFVYSARIANFGYCDALIEPALSGIALTKQAIAQG